MLFENSPFPRGKNPFDRFVGNPQYPSDFASGCTLAIKLKYEETFYIFKRLIVHCYWGNFTYLAIAFTVLKLVPRIFAISFWGTFAMLS